MGTARVVRISPTVLWLSGRGADLHPEDVAAFGPSVIVTDHRDGGVSVGAGRPTVGHGWPRVRRYWLDRTDWGSDGERIESQEFRQSGL